MELDGEDAMEEGGKLVHNAGCRELLTLGQIRILVHIYLPTYLLGIRINYVLYTVGMD